MTNLPRNIAKRLRTHAETWERIGNEHPSYRDKELLACLREAADEIERLCEENERWHTQCDQAVRKVEVDNERLLAALKEIQELWRKGHTLIGSIARRALEGK